MLNQESTIDDPIWNNWLLDLWKPMKAIQETVDDDPNDDPDFNYMEEVLEEDTEV